MLSVRSTGAESRGKAGRLDAGHTESDADVLAGEGDVRMMAGVRARARPCRRRSSLDSSVLVWARPFRAAA